jgi:hypothetical protein
MSIKKEILNELTKQQLEQLAKIKGIKFRLNKTQKKYYEDWDERDKLVDIMSYEKELKIKDIEDFIIQNR